MLLYYVVRLANLAKWLHSYHHETTCCILIWVVKFVLMLEDNDCIKTCFADIIIPLTALGHIWNVMLDWRKGNIENKLSVFQYCVLL